MNSLRAQSGFSLVELSIVLVILGLLVGGVLSGQSLIRAAELRAVTTEAGRYTTAVRSFQDKYFALPGDMANATAFWGKSAADCNSQSGAVAAPGTCNGNGDGIIDWPVAASATGETFRGWQHMARAGLIEGTYTGNAGPVELADPEPKINVPESRFSQALWGFGYYDNANGSNSYSFNYDMRNWMIIGSEDDSSYTDGPLFRAEEAWNIDTKLDDGRPGTGRVIANVIGLCTNTTVSTNRNASYNLSSSDRSCSVALQTIN
jgi:prepilin-type N-terminal cleavage/methylation domain-containing protein